MAQDTPAPVATDAPAASEPAGANEQPPAFGPTHEIELESILASKLTKVGLYPNRAEITRRYKFAVVMGLNMVNISGLPNALDQDSVRVDGHGEATIHDVSLSSIPPPPTLTSSPKLEELREKKESISNALARSKKNQSSLEHYLTTLNSANNKAAELKDVMVQYDETAALWDDKVSKLNKQLAELERQISEEKVRLEGPKDNPLLRMKASIGVFAEKAADVELILTYAVNNAGWFAGYDIRAGMDTKEKPVTLIYKAIITQSTGEDWNDIPLTLETATPTFGIAIPNLQPWRLRSMVQGYRSMAKSAGFARPTSSSVQYDVSAYDPTIESYTERHAAFQEEYSAPVPSTMKKRVLVVSSKSNVIATFQVPGIVSIPSDGASHTFTIVTLNLDASMTWVSVPKLEAKVQIKAKIHNSSDYTLLPGQTSIYVDGSFIARSRLPSVSPQESFDCSLGVDPSIRISYAPRVKKQTQAGLLSKTTYHSFTQRIQIHNTKTVQVAQVKIIDQIPTSEESDINIKLVDPPLTIPTITDTLKSTVDVTSIFPPVKVSEAVKAQWEGTDEPDCDVKAIGKDGILSWIALVPAQGKVNITLQYEVTTPAKKFVPTL